MKRLVRAVAVFVAVVLAGPVWAVSPFVSFESGQVRPLALSPDGTLLFAVNTPDNRLEIFDVAVGSLDARRARCRSASSRSPSRRATNGEVWVVNHLSDSVSIVDVATPATARVVRTLLVGDEPRDIVFAGPGGNRAFITTAHRGQNTPCRRRSAAHDPRRRPRRRLGVRRRTPRRRASAATPLTIVTLFADTPRALAVSPDGNTVYAAVFHSGNQTTTLGERSACRTAANARAGSPSRTTTTALVVGPEVGLIVKFDGDALGRRARAHLGQRGQVRPARQGRLRDRRDREPAGRWRARPASSRGVGTILFNMAVNPVSGKVYVSNTDAHNDVRFEGAGRSFSRRATACAGHLAESRITVLDRRGASLPRHLNKHIDYGACCAPMPERRERRRASRFPVGMAVSQRRRDALRRRVRLEQGRRLRHRAARGRHLRARAPANQIHGDRRRPDRPRARRDARSRSTCSRASTTRSRSSTPARGDEIAHVAMYNPEPASVTNGRRFLYDATLHLEPRRLGVRELPRLRRLRQPRLGPRQSRRRSCSTQPRIRSRVAIRSVDPRLPPDEGADDDAEPARHGQPRPDALARRPHRRQRRSRARSPTAAAFDEDARLQVVQRRRSPASSAASATLTDADMQAFTDFILQVTLSAEPDPQPRQLAHAGPAGGRATSSSAQRLGHRSQLQRLPRARSRRQRQFGVAARASSAPTGARAFEDETADLQDPAPAQPVPEGRHVRHGGERRSSTPATTASWAIRSAASASSTTAASTRSSASTTRTVFNQQPAATPAASRRTPAGDALRRQVETFMLAFDSNLAPIVGQQVTLTSTSGADVTDRDRPLLAQRGAGECDLVVKGMKRRRVARLPLRRAAPRSESTATASRRSSRPSSRALAATAGPGAHLHLRAARLGRAHRRRPRRRRLPRRDELDAGTDPADPNSIPSGCANDPTCAKCERAIAKEGTKYSGARTKALVGCELSKVKGSLPPATDCTVEAGSKLTKASSKLASAVAKACGGSDKTCGGVTTGETTPAALGWPATCPDFEGHGCTGAISDCSGIVSCLTCVDDAATNQAMALYFGDLAPSTSGSDVNRCQQAIGKESQKFLAAKAQGDRQVLGRPHQRQAHRPLPERERAPGLARAEGRRQDREGGDEGTGEDLQGLRRRRRALRRQRRPDPGGDRLCADVSERHGAGRRELRGRDRDPHRRRRLRALRHRVQGRLHGSGADPGALALPGRVQSLIHAVRARVMPGRRFAPPPGTSRG